MKLRRLRHAAVLTLAAVPVVALAAVPSSDAATHYLGYPKNSYVVAHGFKYEFQRWDADSTHVDNPVSIIFVSRKANLVSRVYADVATIGMTHSGDKMSLRGIGGSRPGVNPTDPWYSHSAGRKSDPGNACWHNCYAHTDVHMRTYGPDGRAGTQVYQGSSGYRPYYLIASTHFDRNENTSSASFGYQDQARSLMVAQLAKVHPGWWKHIATVSIGNSCSGWLDKSHYCKHDGTAWVIDIDGGK